MITAADIAARAKRAEWSDRVALAIALDASIKTPADADRALHEAAEIRGLIRIGARSLQAAGYCVEGLADEFVIARASADQLRVDIVNILAEADESVRIDTARPLSPEDKIIADPSVQTAFENMAGAIWTAHKAQKEKASK